MAEAAKFWATIRRIPVAGRASDGAPRNQERDAPLRRIRGRRRRQLVDRCGRVLHAAGALRLRKDDVVAHDCGIRPPGRRQRLPRRQGPCGPPARSTARADRVPKLCAVPAHDGRRQCRVSAADGEDARRRHGSQGRGGARRRAARRLRQALSERAVRRPEAARGDRPRARHAPDRAAAGRAARRTRREAPRGHADRAHQPAEGHRHHVRLCDPRPDGGAYAVASHRRDERGPRRANGRAFENLRRSEIALRRRFHRTLQPPVGSGHGERRRGRHDRCRRARRDPRRRDFRSGSGPSRDRRAPPREDPDRGGSTGRLCGQSFPRHCCRAPLHGGRDGLPDRHARRAEDRGAARQFRQRPREVLRGRRRGRDDLAHRRRALYRRVRRASDNEPTARIAMPARKEGHLGKWLVSGPPLLYLVVFFALPSLIMVLASFRAPGEFGGLAPLVDEAGKLDLSAESYVRFVTETVYVAVFFKSIVYALVTTFLCLILAYPLAALVAKSPRKYRDLLLLLVILPFWSNFLIRIYAWMIILGPQAAPARGVNGVLGVFGHEPVPLLFSSFAVLVCLVYVPLPFMVLPLYANLEKHNQAPLNAA